MKSGVLQFMSDVCIACIALLSCDKTIVAAVVTFGEKNIFKKGCRC